MTTSASAPGKLMLLGEHAVLYGHPCLVTAVDSRITASVEFVSGRDVTIVAPAVRPCEREYRIPVEDLLSNHGAIQRETAFVQVAIAEVYRRYGVRAALRITTEGPKESYGLGSSSAVTVAVVGALSQLFDLNLQRSELFEIAYAAVRAAQGSASGFDVASAVYGGTLYFFTGGREITPVSAPRLPIVIGYSGRKADTRSYLDLVAELYQRRTSVVNRIFLLIEELVVAARQHIGEEDWRTLGELVNINQGLLDSLGVSTPRLSELVFAARQAGALGAKLSGAGGGDCMLAVVDPHSHNVVEKALQEKDAVLVKVPCNAEGVRSE